MSRSRGPALVLATATLLAATTTFLLWRGFNEANLHEVLRFTARTSLLLFLATFVARPLRALGDSQNFRVLQTNRRYLGLSFATAMTFHLTVLVTLWGLGERFPLPIVIGGSIGFAFIAAMTVTSFPGPAKALGGVRWRQLHTAGMWVYFSIFTFDYLPTPDARITRNVAFLALLGAFALRVGAHFRRRARA